MKLNFNDIETTWTVSFTSPENPVIDNCMINVTNGKNTVSQNVSNNDSLRDDLIYLLEVLDISIFMIHYENTTIRFRRDGLKHLPKRMNHTEIVNKLQTL